MASCWVFKSELLQQCNGPLVGIRYLGGGVMKAVVGLAIISS
jgi:hypothetical protein